MTTITATHLGGSRARTLDTGGRGAVIGKETLYLSPVTLAELEYGVQRAPAVAGRSRA